MRASRPITQETYDQLPENVAERAGRLIALHLSRGELAPAQRVLDHFAKTEMPQPTDPTRLPIAALQLDGRSLNTLETRGLETVADVLACEPSELLATSGVGLRTIERIYVGLARVGLRQTAAAERYRRVMETA